MAQNVGLTLKAAIGRAKLHESASQSAGRRLTVRISTRWDKDLGDGLFVNARITARSNEELLAQQNKGDRFVFWEALDVTDLVALVDEAVAEVEMAVRDAPKPQPRPSGSQMDRLLLASFDKMIEAIAAAFASDALKIVNDPAYAELTSGEKQEAAMCAACQVAALASLTAMIDPTEIEKEFRRALSSVRRRAGLHWPKLPYGGFIE